MSQTYYMTVQEVADELGISKSYAYKLVHRLNQKLKEMNCITMRGRIDREFFHEHIYSARTRKETANGSI